MLLRNVGNRCTTTRYLSTWDSIPNCLQKLKSVSNIISKERAFRLQIEMRCALLLLLSALCASVPEKETEGPLRNS
jgi:hypothetical protein